MRNKQKKEERPPFFSEKKRGGTVEDSITSLLTGHRVSVCVMKYSLDSSGFPFRFFFFCTGSTKEPAKNQLARVLQRRRSVAETGRTFNADS